jgi:hypothetical protein
MHAAVATESNSNVINYDNESMYTRALWEWTHNQLLNARRKSDEAHRRRTGYQQRRHKRQEHFQHGRDVDQTETAADAGSIRPVS